MFSSDDAPLLKSARERIREADLGRERNLESAFISASGEERRRLLRRFLFCLCGVIIACLPLDAWAGILPLGIIVRVVITVPLLILGALTLQRRISSRVEGIAFGAPIVAVVAGTAILGDASNDFFSSRYLMAAAIAMVAVNVVLPLRLIHARVLSAVTFLAYGTVVLGAGRQNLSHNNSDLVGFAAILVLVSLMATRRAESAKRESFFQQRREREALEELRKANELLQTLSHTDALTTVFNRRFFDRAAEHARVQAVQRRTSLALLMIDIDKFKEINDAFGHAEGDVWLQRIAQTIRDRVRSGDLVARYGGEEFAVILPNAELCEGVVIAERVRTGIESLQYSHPLRAHVPTVSIGVAALAAEAAEGIRDLIASADAALYRAKAAGRNRVVAGSTMYTALTPRC